MVRGSKYFPEAEIAAIQTCPDINRLQELAKDPAHNNKISPKSLHEAVVGLRLEAKGLPDGLTPPITRDERPGGGEFIDGNNTVWDVKSPITYIPGSRRKPPKGGFDVDNEIGDIEQELDKGENVILDSTNLDDDDKRALQEKIDQKRLEEMSAGTQPPKWSGRIIWYP